MQILPGLDETNQGRNFGSGLLLDALARQDSFPKNEPAQKIIFSQL